MPLAIILDVSLSMSQLVNVESEEEISRKSLAVAGINILLDHLNAHSKLEFVSLVRNITRAFHHSPSLHFFLYHKFSGSIFVCI